MSKITADHLRRAAYVYVRQSTLDQVQHNHESRRRQYALAGRARQLGWQEVVVLDEDLGRSGSGISRPGFERLIAAVGQGRVGAVVSIEASRLARNGRDWHTLLEFCGLVGSLIIDEDGIYDPRLPNDRLLLGMKGTLSEMELSTFRQRSQEALRQKAARGELLTTVAIGYLRTADDRVEMDPDKRVREAISLVFVKFRELGSMRQVLLWLRQESIELPSVTYGAEGRAVVWKLPVYATILKFLTNPIYGGAYAHGRTRTQTRLQDGRRRLQRGLRRSPEDWEVLIIDHHQGYIAWDEYQQNQRLIAENTNMRGQMARGAVRPGPALLAGMLRCGHCGRKLHVAYSGVPPGKVARYHCRGAMGNHGAGRCISFGSLRIEMAVCREMLRLLDPLGIAAALGAIEVHRHEVSDKRRQIELALNQARFEAARARRQYDAVDPDNRLVAGELEHRWNERLRAVQRLEEELVSLDAEPNAGLTAIERERLLALGHDLGAAWYHPAASPEIKKRILRTVIREVVVWVEEGRLRLSVHWQGGDHTALEVVKNRSGQHRWKTDTDTERIIGELARLLPDLYIASVLNRLGRRTAKGHTWTEGRLRAWRSNNGIPVYREGERAERGELTLDEVARQLSTSKMTVIRLIRSEILPARQVCPGAPYVIRAGDLSLPAVRHAVAGCAVSLDPRQISLLLQ
jgi:DNA invertase Pin-like site-specific DNA recombinase